MHSIIETSLFRRKAEKLLSEAEYETLIATLSENPAAGDVIKGTGGFRKLRLARQGSGKSGGFRVISFFHCDGCPVYLVDIYGKNEQSNLSDEQRNMLAKLATQLKTH